MTRAQLALAGSALAAVLLVVALTLAVRGGDDGAAPTTAAATTSPTTGAPTTATLVPGTLPPTVPPTAPARTTPAPTTAAATSVAPSTVAITTTGPPTTTGSTTTTDPDAAPAFPCRADLLLTAYAAVQRVPPGATAEQARCYGIWASVTLAAPGLDRAFAVFGPGDAGWQLLNAGTAFVCQRLEVPDPAYTTIGCVDWDR